MSEKIHLTVDQVPAVLRRGYDGRKFAVRVCESVTVPTHVGRWLA